MPQGPLTLTEKRKRASLIASSLVTLAALSSRTQFFVKLQVLKDVEKFWREGFEVTVEGVERMNSGSIASSASTDIEDEHVPMANYDSQPLQTISESFENISFLTEK